MWAEIGQAVGGFVSGIFSKKKSSGSSSSGGIDWGNVLSSGIGALGAYYQNKEAKKAAKEAQKDQYGYQKKLLGDQYGYDTKLMNKAAQINTKLAGSSYKYQKALQQQQQQYETQMSNTAYTRATADLRNAGINPLLVNGGASTPSTGMGTVSAGSVGAGNVSAGGVAMDDRAQQMNNAINNALHMRELNIMAKNAQYQNMQAESQAILNAEVAKTEENKRKNMDSQTVLNEINRQIKQAEADNAPEYWKKTLRNMDSIITMNIANAEMLKTGAYKNSVEAAVRQEVGSAEAEKYRKEAEESEQRKRGYSIDNLHKGTGKLRAENSSTTAGVKIFGVGGNITKTHSYERR